VEEMFFGAAGKPYDLIILHNLLQTRSALGFSAFFTATLIILRILFYLKNGRSDPSGTNFAVFMINNKSKLFLSINEPDQLNSGNNKHHVNPDYVSC
jgi:hypothetical protein